MRVNAIICPKCGDTVFSRVHHDMRWCECGPNGGCAIDGGFSYVRIVWTEGFVPMQTTLNIRQTKKQLYDDWNNRTDKFGIIKSKKHEK